MENTVIPGLLSLSQNHVMSLDLKNGNKILEMLHNPTVSWLGFWYLQTSACVNCTVLTSLSIKGVYFKWIAINDKGF